MFFVKRKLQIDPQKQILIYSQSLEYINIAIDLLPQFADNFKIGIVIGDIERFINDGKELTLARLIICDTKHLENIDPILVEKSFLILADNKNNTVLSKSDLIENLQFYLEDKIFNEINQQKPISVLETHNLFYLVEDLTDSSVHYISRFAMMLNDCEHINDGQKCLIDFKHFNNNEEWISLRTNAISNDFSVGKIEFSHKDKLYSFILFAEKQVADDTEFIHYYGTELNHFDKLNKNSTDTFNSLVNLKALFISMITHEFRTPLTSIMLSADLLQRYGKNWDTEMWDNYFKKIKDTILQMTKLMENVLIINKIETGSFQIHPELVDIADFCKNIWANVSLSSNSKHKLNFTITPLEQNYIKIDENITGLILNNLLSNAIKYSSKADSIDLSIFISSDEIVFKIKDYGMGINPDDINKIYNTFYRGKNVGPIPGYGLGLYIVKMCIELYKGHVEFESQLDSGTEFTITLPYFA